MSVASNENDMYDVNGASVAAYQPRCSKQSTLLHVCQIYICHITKQPTIQKHKAGIKCLWICRYELTDRTTSMTGALSVLSL